MHTHVHTCGSILFYCELLLCNMVSNIDLFSAETDIVRSNVDVLVTTGLGSRAEEDFLLARDTCVTLLKLVKTKVCYNITINKETSK